MEWNIVIVYLCGVATLPFLFVLIGGAGYLQEKKERREQWVEDFAVVENELIFYNKEGAEIARAPKGRVYVSNRSRPFGLEMGYEALIGEHNFKTEEKIGETLAQYAHDSL